MSQRQREFPFVMPWFRVGDDKDRARDDRAFEAVQATVQQTTQDVQNAKQCHAAQAQLQRSAQEGHMWWVRAMEGSIKHHRTAGHGQLSDAQRQALEGALEREHELELALEDAHRELDNLQVVEQQNSKLRAELDEARKRVADSERRAKTLEINENQVQSSAPQSAGEMDGVVALPREVRQESACFQFLHSLRELVAGKGHAASERALMENTGRKSRVTRMAKERSNLHSQVSSLQSANDLLKVEHEASQIERNELLMQIEHLEEETADMRHKRAEMEKELIQANDRENADLDAVHRLEQEKATLDERNQQLELQQKTLQQEVAQLRAQLLAKEEDHDKALHAAQKSSLLEKRARLADEEKAVIEREKDKLKEDLKSFRHKYVELETVRADAAEAMCKSKESHRKEKEQIVARLTELEDTNDTLAVTVRNLEREVKSKRDMEQTDSAQLESMRQQVNKFQAERNRLQSEKESLQMETQRHKQTMEAERERNTRKDMDMRDHLQACLSERDSLQEDRDRLQKRDRERQELVARHVSEHDALQSALTLARADYSDARKEIEERKAEVARGRSRLAQKEGECQTLVTECERLRREYQRLETGNAEVQDETSRDAKRMHAEILKLQQQVERLNLEKTNLEGEHERARKARSDVAKQVDEFESQMRDLSSRHQEVQLENRKLRDELTFHESSAASSRGMSDATLRAQQLSMVCEGLQKELNELRDENAILSAGQEQSVAMQGLQSEINKLRDENAILSAGQEQALSLKADTEKLADKRQQEFMKLQTENERLRAENAFLLSSSEESATNLPRDMGEQVADMQVELDHLREENQSLLAARDQVQQLSRTCDALQSEGDTLRAEIGATSSRFQQAVQAKTTAVTQLEEATNRCHTLQAETERLRAENLFLVDAHQLTGTESEQQVKRYAARCQGLQAEVEQLQKDNKQLSGLRSQVEHFASDREANQREVELLREDIARLSDENKQLAVSARDAAKAAENARVSAEKTREVAQKNNEAFVSNGAQLQNAQAHNAQVQADELRNQVQLLRADNQQLRSDNTRLITALQENNSQSSTMEQVDHLQQQLSSLRSENERLNASIARSVSTDDATHSPSHWSHDPNFPPRATQSLTELSPTTRSLGASWRPGSVQIRTPSGPHHQQRSHGLDNSGTSFTSVSRTVSGHRIQSPSMSSSSVEPGPRRANTTPLLGSASSMDGYTNSLLPRPVKPSMVRGVRPLAADRVSSQSPHPTTLF